jgi:hypothetical protein
MGGDGAENDNRAYERERVAACPCLDSRGIQKVGAAPREKRVLPGGEAAGRYRSNTILQPAFASRLEAIAK